MIVLRKVYGALEFVVAVWKELDWPTRFGMAAVITVTVFVLAMVVSTIKSNNHQKGLLATGLCEPITRAMYQPPVSYTHLPSPRDRG